MKNTPSEWAALGKHQMGLMRSGNFIFKSNGDKTENKMDWKKSFLLEIQDTEYILEQAYLIVVEE